jgi:hypothetical protein
MNVFFSVVLVLAAGAAFLAVIVARSQTDVTLVSQEMMNASLKSCQTELASLRLQRPNQPVNIAPHESLDKLSKSCDQAIQAVNTRLENIQESTNEVASAQPWTITKIFFFAALVLLVAFAIRKW